MLLDCPSILYFLHHTDVILPANQLSICWLLFYYDKIFSFIIHIIIIM